MRQDEMVPTETWRVKVRLSRVCGLVCASGVARGSKIVTRVLGHQRKGASASYSVRAPCRCSTGRAWLGG